MSLRATSWLVPLIFAAAACGAEDDKNGGSSPMAGSGGAAGITGGVGGASGQGGAGGIAGIGGVGGGGGVAGNVVAGEGGVGGAAGGVAGGGAGGEGGMGGTGDCASTVLNAMFSPGGDAPLPFPCEPFHPTTNNPYAVRCVDAWPWYDSGFPGDDFCILPPPPDKGIQYGVHPQGREWYAQVSAMDLSGYDNPPDSYLLEVGGEEEFNYYTTAGNETAINFYRNHTRMRSGSHHMIVSAGEKAAQLESWGAGDPVTGLFSQSLPGAQRPDENTPKSLTKPDEDTGYYQVLPADSGVAFDMHHFNATEEPILKEAWTNLWFETDTQKLVSGLRGLDLVQVATMSIQPGQTVDYHYTLSASQRVRIVTLFGHRHAWTTNFSAWIDKGGGDTEIMYQSFDWYDEPTYRYDSLTTNPVPDHATMTDGGATGIRWLEPGQDLHFNCRIQYTDARADAVSAPVSPTENGALRFANEAFTAEMCILFGSTAEGPALNAPAIAVDPLPDFATAE